MDLLIYACRFLYYFLCAFFIASMAFHGHEDTIFAKKDSLNVRPCLVDKPFAEGAGGGEVGGKLRVAVGAFRRFVKEVHVVA